MCWKDEWAKAVNNLEWAIIHTERAQGKLEKKRRFPGVDKCEEIIADLRQKQEQLKELIETYGITRTENPAMANISMVGRRTSRGKPWI